MATTLYQGQKDTQERIVTVCLDRATKSLLTVELEVSKVTLEMV